MRKNKKNKKKVVLYSILALVIITVIASVAVYASGQSDLGARRSKPYNTMTSSLDCDRWLARQNAALMGSNCPQLSEGAFSIYYYYPQDERYKYDEGSCQAFLYDKRHRNMRFILGGQQIIKRYDYNTDSEILGQCKIFYQVTKKIKCSNLPNGQQLCSHDPYKTPESGEFFCEYKWKHDEQLTYNPVSGKCEAVVSKPVNVCSNENPKLCEQLRSFCISSTTRCSKGYVNPEGVGVCYDNRAKTCSGERNCVSGGSIFGWGACKKLPRNSLELYAVTLDYSANTEVMLDENKPTSSPFIIMVYQTPHSKNVRGIPDQLEIVFEGDDNTKVKVPITYSRYLMYGANWDIIPTGTYNVYLQTPEGKKVSNDVSFKYISPPEGDCGYVSTAEQKYRRTFPTDECLALGPQLQLTPVTTW